MAGDTVTGLEFSLCPLSIDDNDQGFCYHQ